MTTYLKSLFAMEKCTRSTLRKTSKTHLTLGVRYNELVDKFNAVNTINFDLLDKVVAQQDQINNLENLCSFYKNRKTLNGRF